MPPPPGAAVAVVSQVPLRMCLGMRALRRAQGRPAAEARVRAGAAPDPPLMPRRRS